MDGCSTWVLGEACRGTEGQGCRSTDHCPRVWQDEGKTPLYLFDLGSLQGLEDQESLEDQVIQHLLGNHARLLGLVSPVLGGLLLLESP